MTAILLAFLTCSIVFSVMVLLVLPRPADEERAAEDLEFSIDMGRRRGDRT